MVGFGRVQVLLLKKLTFRNLILGSNFEYDHTQEQV